MRMSDTAYLVELRKQADGMGGFRLAKKPKSRRVLKCSMVPLLERKVEMEIGVHVNQPVRMYTLHPIQDWSSKRVFWDNETYQILDALDAGRIHSFLLGVDD